MLQLSVHSQVHKSTLDLGKGIRLTGYIEKFDKTKHKYDTCEGNYICKIDGKKWFGLDRSLALPETQLIRLSIRINGRNIPLYAVGMFNPTYAGDLYQSNSK